ncbi:hypothetical protein [Mycobacterium vicinigordonae]|uniref:ParB/Sulfiredoxin domain-containing protein n=1 Tax=Mycobacterium vicinigordonae TaxID=1719132 RepID=A0A7D6HWY1_9MYCO|nr:hypothetical protein [Mycobacterium vicinigordonae]QLL08893.1 hypothetical protein H0P51_08350 [Mycobacterium vicinigordonae]
MLRRFVLRDQVPDILRDVILDVQWDASMLHALSGLTEVKISVNELAWHLGLPFWSDNGVPFQVCPRDVRADPDRYHDQWARTLASDLSFPLHARVDEGGRVVILDGVHRLLKATVFDEELMNVRLVSDEDLYAICAR